MTLDMPRAIVTKVDRMQSYIRVIPSLFIFCSLSNPKQLVILLYFYPNPPPNSMEIRLPAAKHNVEQDLAEDQTPQQCDPIFSAMILQQVSLLNSALSLSASDCANVKSAVFVLSKLAKKKDLVVVDTIVNRSAVPALVRHLQVPDAVKDDVGGVTEYYWLEMAKGCAFILGLLAIQPTHQQLIIEAGALPCLIDLLRRHKISTISQLLSDVLKRVADAITSLALRNSGIKTLVRMEGGIAPLVELLEFNDTEVQRAAAGALRTLAFNNDNNKNQMVECNALPALVLMLQSEDRKIHNEAVSVIGNLVHSSPNIKKHVLLAGALQPIIRLLSSCCSKSQREAALLLGQFASADSDCKVHIAQRGAIPPLVDLLKSPYAKVQEMSAFALGRLAQDSHNQVGIAHNGGIEALLNLLSDSARLQHVAAFALYTLAVNEDIVADIIKAGGFQKLKAGIFKVHSTRGFVAKTLKRLEKTQGRVLKHLIYLMRFAEKWVQRNVAFALAYLCGPHDRKTIFIDNNGLELLLGLLESPDVKQKGEASAALHNLAVKASFSAYLFDTYPPSPTPQMYWGAEYVNNPNLSNVTFLVEGRCFYAHRDCLLSSDIFRAMLDGSYRESQAKQIVIPNIKWDVFELLMRFLYTGKVDVCFDIAQDLLGAADQYLLGGLKRICERAIVKGISVENVSILYNMSEAFNATAIKRACMLFILKKFHNLRYKPWYCPLVDRMIPEIRMYFSTVLVKCHPADSRNHRF
ncbi:ARM REPEAT PROTEIN INTERACTING WITH ABF2 [Cajanus cajan]|uniref:ARM REPEAT PROTEIN INTERACTING WITH ABF2 n=1 Tax=Cajanus cajan TaxID=3821 RepID=UPI00098DD5D4|nr:ARM REPEAT PROTEIN INTERACTING WITH ABF2 [Cajanus cajan]XP_020238768.1 ARM REPEAT PROTEIN INTERACTING WITH ABF2 [Cajanus cajan]